ncbi:hypothetical protein Pmani_012024 [Petrolisthes manimaculis]|uniref:Uncharacterized protein n=1 Tax=Petrolisthes manimaculis TaxID=1843537 RepID=A0AAE1PY00_9EUCA|nr:hypothetical protein Pmani_012024 [Petrolisthes manimaculis]
MKERTAKHEKKKGEEEEEEEEDRSGRSGVLPWLVGWLVGIEGQGGGDGVGVRLEADECWVALDVWSQPVLQGAREADIR